MAFGARDEDERLGSVRSEVEAGASADDVQQVDAGVGAVRSDARRRQVAHQFGHVLGVDELIAVPRAHLKAEIINLSKRYTKPN